MAAAVQREIRGRTFLIGHIPAMQAPKVAKQALSVVGPIAAEIAKLFTGGTAESEIKDAIADGKMTSLLTSALLIDDDKVLSLMMSLAEQSSIVGVPGNLKTNFDVVFTGDLPLLLSWCIEALKVNFGVFLGGPSPAP